MNNLQQSPNVIAQLYNRLKELKVPDSMFNDQHFIKGLNLILKGNAVLWVKDRAYGAITHTTVRIIDDQ